MPDLHVATESWPLARAFTISRGSRTTAEVVVVTLTEDGVAGRGECVPYARYDETVPGVVETIRGMADALGHGMARENLRSAMPAGAARNALDCALWDLEAKRSGKRAWELAGLPEPGPVVTAYTLSLDTPERMGEAAAEAADRPLLKLKLTGEGDLERVAAVRENAPEATLIVDANEGWSPEMVEPYSTRLAELGVALIEQPLPAASDAPLADVAHPVPVCADESAHTTDGLETLAARYDVVNIKLDKTGGLTEALEMRRRARDLGLEIMVGCMIGTSLAMAPAVLVGQGAKVVDLDGPLLLAKDREDGLTFEGSTIHPPDPTLWG